jgi:hypothetical protein
MTTALFDTLVAASPEGQEAILQAAAGEGLAAEQLAAVRGCLSIWPTVRAVEDLTTPESWSVEGLAAQTRKLLDAMAPSGARPRPGLADEDASMLSAVAHLIAPGFAHGLACATGLTPRERAPRIAEDLRRAADDMEELAGQLEALDAPVALARTHAALREALALDAEVCLKRGDWLGSAQARARYLRSYRRSAPTSHPDRNRRPPPVTAFEKIGANLAIVHLKAKMVHRAALLENYMADGGIACLGSAEQLLAPDAERFAEDLVMLRHQCRSSEWNVFVRSYTEVGGVEAARAVARAEELAPAAALGREGERLPFRALPSPHWSIRAVRFALRQSPRAKVDFKAMLESASAAAPGVRLTRLALTALAAEGIDPVVHQGAICQLVDGLRAAIERAPDAATARHVEEALHLFGRDPSDFWRDTLLAFHSHVAALTGDPVARCGHLHEASRHYLRGRHNADSGAALHCLQTAVNETTDPEERGRLVVDLVRALLNLGLEARDGRLLMAAIAVRRKHADLTAEPAAEAAAYSLFAEALLQPDEGRHHDLLRQTLAEAVRYPGLEEFADQVRDQLPNRGAEPAPEGKLQPADNTLVRASRTEDWAGAVEQLGRPPAETQDEDSIALRAAEQALAYQEMAERDPRRTREAAAAVAEIARRHAHRIRQFANIVARRTAANYLGWALIRLPSAEPETRLGVELLELALSLSDDATDRIGRSFTQSNLANGYRALARFASQKEALKLFAKAEEMFREVAALDEQLCDSIDPRERNACKSLDLDYFNIGLVCESQAIASYDATLISHKPLESARHRRNAIIAFARSAELARERVAIRASAEMGLARSMTALCRHYYQERQWASGDLERAFYLWLAEVAGGEHVSTRAIIEGAAETALAAAASAAEYGVAGNPSVLVEAADEIATLWGLLRRTDELPDHVRLHCTMTVAEWWDRVSDSGRAEQYAANLAGFADMAALARASCYADLFREATSDFADLHAALNGLRKCAAGGHPVVRGIARLSLKWLDADAEPGSCSANGLYLGAGPDDSLELRFAGHRRSVTLRGVRLFSTEVKLMHRRQAIDRISRAVAHLEPLLEQDRVPEHLAAIEAVAVGRDIECDVHALRVPLPAWDTWLVTVTARRPGRLALDISLPYLGRYDPGQKEFRHDFPAAIEAPYQTLTFGRRGLSIEVLAADYDDKGHGVSLRGSREHPVIEVSGHGCRLLFKVAPRVVGCEAAVLVREEGPTTALCCAVTPPVSSPSRSLPSATVNAFAPLFFFRNAIEPGVTAFLERTEVRMLVIVGVPEKRGELSRFLGEVYDPALEVALAVNAEEVSRAVDELNRFGNLLHERLGSRALFASASALIGPDDPLESFQVIVAERAWAPAAVQMLLDLAVLRRINLEGLPMFHEGRVSYLNVKGNPRGMRHLQTTMRGVSDIRNLFTLYGGLCQGVAKMESFDAGFFHVNTGLEDLVAGRVPARPLYLLPEDARTRIALSPHVRVCKALPIPADGLTPDLAAALNPHVVYAPSTLAAAVARVVPDCQVREIATEPEAICAAVVQASDDMFDSMVEEIGRRSPHLKAQAEMVETLRPSRYAVLSTWSDANAGWAIALANYAASMGGPILFAPEPPSSDLELLRRRLRQLDHFRGPAVTTADSPPVVRGEAAVELRSVCEEMGRLIAPQLGILERLKPIFVGTATPLVLLPLELAGTPPLGLRWATGRLAGPDLASTCEIIAWAALAEEVTRRPWLEALLLCASGAGDSAVLESAREELEAAARSLGQIPFVRTQALVDAPDDLRQAKAKTPRVDLLHFAGHAGHLGTRGEVALMLTGGPWVGTDLPELLNNHPIVFANACSSASLEGKSGEAARGLAAEFLRRGAVNYLGNLWPVVDSSAATMAGEFYRQLCAGRTVGESLLFARRLGLASDDVSWAAMVLFGCPRNRIVTV